MRASNRPIEEAISAVLGSAERPASSTAWLLVATFVYLSSMVGCVLPVGAQTAGNTSLASPPGGGEEREWRAPAKCALPFISLLKSVRSTIPTPSNALRPAPRMGQHVARDEACAVGAEDADCGAELAAFAQSPERDLRGHLGHRVLVGEQGGREVVGVLDIVRADRVHRDAVAAQFLGERVHQTVRGSAGRGIGRVIGDAAQRRRRR